MRCLYECEIHTHEKTIQDWSNANTNKIDKVREDSVKSVLKQREKEMIFDVWNSLRFN
jgi:hypothetical protein